MVRQDRDRLNLIIENVGDPIVVCDRDAKVVLLDPLAQDLLGSEKNRSGLHMRNQTKLDAYVTKFTYSFTDRESALIQLTHPCTHQDVEYDARSGKIYDERGLVAYTVTVLRDLTAVRRLEQLKMERRMLEMEKFAVAGRLAGTIAHEVNNPLEAIKNCIFMLNDQMKPEAGPVYEILKAETERVARIVRQMLGLYRNTEQVGNVEVNSVVEDTLLLFARQLDRAGVRMVKELDTIPSGVRIGRPDPPGTVEPGGERQGQHEPGRPAAGANACVSQGPGQGDDSNRGGRYRQRHLRNHAEPVCSSRSLPPRASGERDWACGS